MDHYIPNYSFNLLKTSIFSLLFTVSMEILTFCFLLVRTFHIFGRGQNQEAIRQA